MSDLTNQVLSHLDPASIEAIANQLGIDPAQAEAAIQQAVPVVVGGLARNAQTDAGADALHQAAQDHAGGDIGSILGSVLGGQQAGGGIDSGIGGAILGHVFGNNVNAANQGLGQTTGLGTQGAGQLMAILAPIVMSVLANMSQKQGLSPGGLGNVLAQQAQTTQQQGGVTGGLLNAVLDHNGDGHIDLSEMMAAAGGAMNAMGRRS